MQGAYRSLQTYFFCVAQSNIELLFCPRTSVLSVIVLEIETGVLAGSFLPSCRLEMSEMSEVSEELRVYAVRERKCWTKTEILDVLKEVEDYALDSPPPIIFCLRQTRRKITGSPQSTDQLSGQGVQGLLLRGAFPGIPILRNFDVIMKCSKPIVGYSKPIVRVRNPLSAALTSNHVRN